ncbi:MAG: mechanosensitive ion channel [Bacteroidetes bacterium]|nr:mechanosensitive ion channel [Bacteroidota bacterium]
MGSSTESARYLNMLILFAALVIVVLCIDYIGRKLLLGAFVRYSARTKTQIDDLLVKNRAPRNVAHILPLLIAIQFIPTVFTDFHDTEFYAEHSLKLLGIVLALRIVRSFLNALKDYLKTLPHLKDKPLDSYIQVVMIFAWLVGIIMGFAQVTGIKPWKFFTALGAASAVIILVFRDTILGFVASIQVSINDMVRIGDWITFDKYGADGDVIEINLATVKVQNFDYTITTIPTYALISDSFRNWRGMVQSDGRRIKRSLNIKQKSIRFLSDEDILRLEKIQLISEYLAHRSDEISKYNEQHEADKSLAINGRNMTNIGVFRKYIDTYLKHHSAINKEMIIMVRQLQPTPTGIPIEIYAFSKDKRWANYEFIIADIFDHLLSAVSFFDLEVYEMRDNGE